jgi:glycosyltransferase involved in cell wall biosynthesis
MNILHLYSDENWTGPAESVLNFLQELNKRRHQVFFAGVTKRKGRFLPRIREAGIPVIENLNLDRKTHPLNYCRNLINLSGRLKKEKIDIIHTHFRYGHILSSFVTAGIPLIRTLHRADLVKVNFEERFILRAKTAYITTISEAIRERVIRDWRIEPERISTIYPPIDSKKYHPRLSGVKIREGLGIGKDCPVVGMVAPLQPHRKHLLFLQSICQVREKFPKVKALLIGSIGSYQRVLRKEIERLGISGAIIFTGYRNEEYPQILASLDMAVFLVPGSDGSCRAVWETLAMEKAIVSAKVGPMPEIMENGREGILIDTPVTARSLAKAIIEVLHNENLRKKMGSSGRRLAEELNIGSYTDQMEKIYLKFTTKNRKH